jgi:hypothetical protein
MRDERFGQDPAAGLGPEPLNQQPDYSRTRSKANDAYQQTRNIEDGWESSDEADRAAAQAFAQVFAARAERSIQNRQKIQQLRNELMGAGNELQISIDYQSSCRRTVEVAYQEVKMHKMTYDATKAQIELKRHHARGISHDIDTETHQLKEYREILGVLRDAYLRVWREPKQDPPSKTPEVDEYLQIYAVRGDTDPNASSDLSIRIQDAIANIQDNFAPQSYARRESLKADLLTETEPLAALGKKAQQSREDTAVAKREYYRLKESLKQAEYRTCLITGRLRQIRDEIDRQLSPTTTSIVDEVKQLLDAARQQPAVQEHRRIATTAPTAKTLGGKILSIGRKTPPADG